MIMDVEPHNRELLLLSSSDDSFFSSGSELSSPIGSAQSSSSTESREEGDDYIGELTRLMAQYMLQEEDKHEKTWGLPDSQLGSSNLDSCAVPFRGPSPPLTPMIRDFETARFTTTSTSIQEPWRNPNIGFQSKQALITDQIRAIQSRLKQEKGMKQMKQKARIMPSQNKEKVFDNSNNSLYNPHQHQQQQQQRQSNRQGGSNMRAVFLNSPGLRNGSSGTGVFLPRVNGTPCQSRKTQGCATVLIPARVVQALKLHFEKTGVPSRFNNGFPPQHDASASGGKSMYPQQKRQSKTVPDMNPQEIVLPQEWTY